MIITPVRSLRSLNTNLLTGISRLITSSKPFHPPRYLPPRGSAFADILHVYKFHLLTYLRPRRRLQ